MLDKYLQSKRLNVIFIGDFNPVIFQPSWLAHKKLIREDEAENAKIEVIHTEVVQYKIGDWLQFECTRDRCIFTTLQEPFFIVVKDLINGVFSLLKETPIRAFGINVGYNINSQSKENYYNIGKSLTPLSLWEEDLNDPRLSKIEILEQKRKDFDKTEASRTITITSSKDPRIPFGVLINVNNHFSVKDFKNSDTANALLNEVWDISNSESLVLVEKLINKVLSYD